MDNLNLRKDSEGNPLIEDCQKYNFGGFYNSPEAQTLFRAIYDNKGGLQDKFVNFWVHVAKRFANNKYVMGFDPLNEPTVSMDNLFNAVDHLSKGEMDKTVLQPLFARLHKEAYQAANPNSIMVFEPVVFPDVVAVKVLGVQILDLVRAVGFNKPPGGEVNSTNHALNAHTYCCQLNTEVCATGEPAEGSDDICLAFHKERVGQRVADA